MSKMALHIEHFKKGAVGSIAGHNWYKRGAHDEHSNQDIDPARSKDNIALVLPEEGSFYQDVKATVEQATGRVTAASVWVSEWILYPPEELQDPFTVDKDRLRQYYGDAMDWMQAQGYQVKLVAIHMDESTVHAHIDTVPLTKDGRLSRKDVYTRSAMSAIHTGLSRYLADKGWDIQRGESTKGKGVSAKTVKVYKAEAEKEKLRLQAELDTLKDQADQARQEVEAAKEDAAKARQEVEAAKEDAAKARQEVEAAKEEAAQARQEVKAAKEDAAKARQKAEELEQQIDMAEIRLSGAEIAESAATSLAEAARLEAEAAQEQASRAMQEAAQARQTAQEYADRIQEQEDTLQLISDYDTYCQEAQDISKSLDMLEQAVREAPIPDTPAWLRLVEQLLQVIWHLISRLLIYERSHDVTDRRSGPAQRRAAALDVQIFGAASRASRGHQEAEKGHIQER